MNMFNNIENISNEKLQDHIVDGLLSGSFADKLSESITNDFTLAVTGDVKDKSIEVTYEDFSNYDDPDYNVAYIKFSVYDREYSLTVYYNFFTNSIFDIVYFDKDGESTSLDNTDQLVDTISRYLDLKLNFNQELYLSFQDDVTNTQDEVEFLLTLPRIKRNKYEGFEIVNYEHFFTLTKDELRDGITKEKSVITKILYDACMNNNEDFLNSYTVLDLVHVNFENELLKSFERLLKDIEL